MSAHCKEEEKRLTEWCDMRAAKARRCTMDPPANPPDHHASCFSSCDRAKTRGPPASSQEILEQKNPGGEASNVVWRCALLSVRGGNACRKLKGFRLILCD